MRHLWVCRHVWLLSASDTNMIVGFNSFRASLMSQILFVIPLAQFQWHTVKGKLFCLEFVCRVWSFFTDCLCFSNWVVVGVEFVETESGSILGPALAEAGWVLAEFGGLCWQACRSVPEFVSAIKKTCCCDPLFCSSMFVDFWCVVPCIQPWSRTQRGMSCCKSLDAGTGTSSSHIRAPFGLPGWTSCTA